MQYNNLTGFLVFSAGVEMSHFVALHMIVLFDHAGIGALRRALQTPPACPATARRGLVGQHLPGMDGAHEAGVHTQSAASAREGLSDVNGHPVHGSPHYPSTHHC